MADKLRFHSREVKGAQRHLKENSSVFHSQRPRVYTDPVLCSALLVFVSAHVFCSPSLVLGFVSDLLVCHITEATKMKSGHRRSFSGTRRALKLMKLKKEET